MRRVFWPVVLIIVASNLQDTLPAWLSLWGGRPNLVLVVLIAYSLAADLTFGALLGFLAGLVQGSAVGLGLGSFIFTRTITGFLAGLVTTRVFSDNPVVPVLSTFCLTLVCESLFLLVNPRPDLHRVAWQVVGESVYNSVFGLAFYLGAGYLESRRKLRLVNARI